MVIDFLPKKNLYFKMNIDLQKFCGKQTITRDDGEKVRDLIFFNWKKHDKIVLDFKNIQIASVSFIDEAFGMLANGFTRGELKDKLEFTNMDDYDKYLLNDILLSRFRQKEAKKNPSGTGVIIKGSRLAIAKGKKGITAKGKKNPLVQRAY